MSDLTIGQRVTNGVAYLDQYMPDWLDHVDLDLLDLGDECSCVLGQLVGWASDPEGELDWDRLNYCEVAQGNPGSYISSRMVENARSVGLPGVLTVPEAAAHGFHVGEGGDEPEWQELTDEWRERITQLRKERSNASH